MFDFLDAEGFSFVAVIGLFLSDLNLSVTDLSEMCGMDRTTISKTISGVRESEKARKCISSVVGFDPWE